MWKFETLDQSRFWVIAGRRKIKIIIIIPWITIGLIYIDNRFISRCIHIRCHNLGNYYFIFVPYIKIRLDRVIVSVIHSNWVNWQTFEEVEIIEAADVLQRHQDIGVYSNTVIHDSIYCIYMSCSYYTSNMLTEYMH